MAMLAVFVAAMAPTQADTDLWGHLRFGADIVATGSIPGRDPYAFTSAGAWVNQSWLADVLMHTAFAAGGTAAIVVVKLALALGILAIVGATLRRAGVRSPLLELLLFVCLAGLYPSIPTLRPQLFSLLLFAILLHLQAGDRPRLRRLLLVPAIMAAWANLHGSWTLGLAELYAWSLTWMVVRRISWRERLALAAIVAAAALATLATPYGVGLWTRTVDTFGSSLRDVTEWRGLLETGSAAVVVWIALVALGLYAMRVGRPPIGELIVLVWLAVASWRVRRLLPFFSLATVSLLAPQFVELGHRASLRRRRASAPPRPGLRVGLAAAAVALAVSSGWRVARAFTCLPMDEAIDADVRAAAFIETNHLSGRLLTYSDWGLYAIWHFAPDLRVSMDGRREFAYPKAELERHNAIYWNAPSALEDVRALDPDFVWLPSALPVIPVLERQGWPAIFTTERSVVLGRASSPRTYVVPPPAPVATCFPGDPG